MFSVFSLPFPAMSVQKGLGAVLSRWLALEWWLWGGSAPVAWVTVPPCGICLQHQRDSLQDQQLLFWFRRILLVIAPQ